MKPDKKANSLRLQTLHRISARLLPFLAILLLIPVVVLLGFGLYAIYWLGYAGAFVILMLVCTVLAAIPSVLFKRRVWQYSQHKQHLPESVDSLVDASTDWSDFDQATWLLMNEVIQTQLQADPRWESLRGHALTLVRRVAEQYHTSKRGEWVFTLPELLKMTEEVSRRYRSILKQHVPLAENINLSTLRWVYEHRDKQKTLENIWGIYRIVRLLTPTGWLSEARSQVTSYLFRDLKDELQMTLKRALLQEVASVAIDLYSGRFKVDSDAIGNSTHWQADQQHLAAPPEPLRVAFIGQVSAGKSSIINALIGNMAAEVSQLPSTENCTIYQLQLQDTVAVHLVDLPGLEGQSANEQSLLEEAVRSDVLVWVLKANQSARALDITFRERLDAWFADNKNRSRKRPVVLGLLNQVDRLPPVHEWQPPYVLDADDSRKANTIRDALAYNRELLSLPLLIPLSVSEDKQHYNLAALQQLLDENYEKGLQTQLNRRRLEAAQSFSVQEQFKRAYRMGQSLFKKRQA